MIFLTYTKYLTLSYYMYADRFANIINNTDLDQSVSTINSVLNGQQ